MEGEVDWFLEKFRAQPKREQSRCVDSIFNYWQHDPALNPMLPPIELGHLLIKLSKSMHAISKIIAYQPEVLVHFPILKSIYWSLPNFAGPDDFYKKSGQSLEQFVFHALISKREEYSISFLMRRFGLSAAGTDDQYYFWVADLERRARCYRAVSALLGIARFRRPPIWQRDTLQMVAKALWNTRGELEWFLLD